MSNEQVWNYVNTARTVILTKLGENPESTYVNTVRTTMFAASEGWYQTPKPSLWRQKEGVLRDCDAALYHMKH